RARFRPLSLHDALPILFLWGGSELLSRGSDSVTGSLALPALSVKYVDTISVVKGTDSIVIVKQSPTAWSVNGHRAALDAVGELRSEEHTSELQSPDHLV